MYFHQAIAAIASDPWGAFGVNLYSVRLRPFGLHPDKLDVTRFGIKAADHVAALQSKPKDAVIIKNRGMGITGPRIRHLVLVNLAGLRIEITDCPVLVAGVPDVTSFIESDGMRFGILR